MYLVVRFGRLYRKPKPSEHREQYIHTRYRLHNKYIIIVSNENNTITNPTFTYYDPVEAPFIIDASTEISITFDGIHTWVSDLAYYAINPSSTSTITLAPRQTGTGNCNNANVE